MSKTQKALAVRNEIRRIMYQIDKQELPLSEESGSVINCLLKAAVDSLLTFETEYANMKTQTVKLQLVK